MRLRIEYCPEGGDPKAMELYSRGEIRELTYEAMDEVLKADITEAELTAITRLLDSMDVTEDVPCRLADAITLSYHSGGQAKFLFGVVGSPQFAALLDVWTALERLRRRYFTPRFY